MVKICRRCFNMFGGNVSSCPAEACGCCKLIVIDENFATVIDRFLSMNIPITSCVSEPLNESCFSRQLTFWEPRSDQGHKRLSLLRTIFWKANESLNLVDIGEIEPSGDIYTFTIREKECDDDPILRLAVHNDFLIFLLEGSVAFGTVMFGEDVFV